MELEEALKIMGRPSVTDKPLTDISFEETMEEYRNIIKALGVVVKHVKGIKIKVETSTIERTKLQTTLTEMRTRVREEVNSAIESEKAKYKNVDLSEFESKIQKVNKSLQTLETQYKAKLEGITEDNVLKTLTESEEEFQDIKNTVDNMQELLGAKLGVETLTSINNRIDNEERSDINSKEIAKLKKDSVQFTETIAIQLEKKTSNPYKIVDSIVDKPYTILVSMFNPGSADLIYVVMAILGIVGIIFVPYGYLIIGIPFILMAFSFYGTYSINKSLVNSYIPLRRMSSYVKDKEGSIQDRVKTEVSKQKDSLTGTYQTKKKSLEDKLSTIQKDMKSFEMEQVNKFDETGMRNELNMKHSSQIERQKRTLDTLTEDLDKQQKELSENYAVYKGLDSKKDKLKDLIKTLFDNLENMDIGESNNINDIFFYQLDNRNDDKPVFFEWDRQTSVIAYDDVSESSIRDFIETIQMQIFLNMNPTKLFSYVVDTENSGAQYSDMFPKSTGNKKLFHRISTTGEIKKMVTELGDRQTEMIEKYLTNHDGIYEYNKYMEEQKSMTLEYSLIYFIANPINTFSDETLKQILKNSRRIGILPIVFIRKDSLAAIMTKDETNYESGHLDLLESIGDESLWFFEDHVLKHKYHEDSETKELVPIGKVVKDIISDIRKGR